MSINTLQPPSKIDYTIEMIRDEVRELLNKGTVSRYQPIYILCQYIPPREWVCVECELEKCDYLLRDNIGDLIPAEDWDND